MHAEFAVEGGAPTDGHALRITFTACGAPEAVDGTYSGST
jgi:hypothetical protein